MIKATVFRTQGRGLHDITARIDAIVRKARIEEGLCTLFVQHTSASLVVQENADESARRDLERWMERLVPDDDASYTHREEGPDDMPSHIKAALTAVSISIPVLGGRIALGTWQGVYLWEHRLRGRERSVVVHLGA